MFSWLSLAITLFKLLNSIFSWYKEQSLINEGYDRAIAEEAQKTLAMTTRGKALLEKINAKSDAEVDADLRGLEPPSAG